nr:tyrosine-type recombinase/integrase [Novosphingobium pokkalii]
MLLRAIDDFTGTEVVKLAMQILPHVFLRPGELRFGKWDEIDWGGAVWRVPAERTKLRRPHSVPLSRQSLELLRSLHERTGQLPYMFPGHRKFTVPICENAINLAFGRMGLLPMVLAKRRAAVPENSSSFSSGWIDGMAPTGSKRSCGLAVTASTQAVPALWFSMRKSGDSMGCVTSRPCSRNEARSCASQSRVWKFPVWQSAAQLRSVRGSER